MLNRPERVFDIIAICFVSFLLIANVSATKLFHVGDLIFDGGAVLFPLTYVLGDVLAEVYGIKKARRVIVIGFVMSIIASLTFYIVQLLPPAPDYEHQEAFEAVLGFLPRIVAASLVAYLIGQLLNAFVLTLMKKKWGADRLWVRLLGSSVVGEAADTIIFCTIAFFGILVGADFWNYVVVGFVFKIAVEIVFMPVTYRVIAWVKGDMKSV